MGKKSGDDAVFSCDYNTFSDATPTVKWFKKNSAPGQQDAEQSSSGTYNVALSFFWRIVCSSRSVIAFNRSSFYSELTSDRF